MTMKDRTWVKAFVLGSALALAACSVEGTISSDDGGNSGKIDPDNPGTGGNTGITDPDNPGTGGNTGITDPDNPGTGGNSGTDKPSAGEGDKPGTDADACKNIDLMTSAQNCGTCGNACGEYDTCEEGVCTCMEGYSDCDGDGKCDTEGECECMPGDTLLCYQGAQETMNVGECKSGVWQCEKRATGKYGWGDTCVGQVMPSYHYICDPTRPDLDVDCDGRPDATQDDDGDGYTICNPAGDAIWDCCDNYNMCETTHPEFIHPGRAECDGNGIDDNCDGKIDDAGVTCEELAKTSCEIQERSCGNPSNWAYPNVEFGDIDKLKELAFAIDACVDIVTKDSKKSGILEISVDNSNAESPKGEQINILSGMFDTSKNKLIAPRAGESFVLLSSGYAMDAKALNEKGYYSGDFTYGSEGKIPEPYKTAHKNQLQTHPSCPTGGTKINDAVHLHLKMRAPENAKGFSFDFRFFSREYPYYVCTEFNDFFLALLTDENGKPLPGVGDDGNISFDKKGNPVSVNNAFFTTCANPRCGAPNICKLMSCDPEAKTCGTSCVDGSAEVAAYYPNPYLYSSDPVNSGGKRGGGTAWLTTQAPVVPGEVFNLDFYIWDTGDHAYDSTVILDNFQWRCDETKVGTDFATGSGKVN